MSATISTDLLLVERPQPGCALVTLNRPAAMNALSLELRRRLVAAFGTLAEDTRVQAIVLTGAGLAFCAGLDLKELSRLEDSTTALSTEAALNPIAAVHQCGKPVIAAVNGAAITGGFELALACDVLVASERASFRDTHSRVGVLPGWGLSQKLPRLVGEVRAKELAFTARTLPAGEALSWGLVTRVLPPSELLAEALSLAVEMTQAAPGMLGAYRSLIDEGLSLSLADALALEARRSAEKSAQMCGAHLAPGFQRPTG